MRKFYVFSSFTGRRNNSVCLFLVVSCPDYRGKLSYNWSLCKREKTSKEEPFTGCKHGFRRFDFRSCFLAFVCLLRYRAHVSAVEMGYIIQNVAYRLGCRWYHLRAGIINLSCLYSLWEVLRHFSAAETPNSIIQSVLHCNCYHLNAVCRSAEYLISCKAATYFWMSFPLLCLFIVCLCNIGIYRTFHKRKASSQQGNRESQTKRLTVTLLLVSTVSLLSWLPLVTANYIFFVKNITIPKLFLIYNIINILNFSNCFLNSVVYSLRILEFRQSLVLCFTRRQTVINRGEHERRDNREIALTPGIEPSAISS